MDLATVLLLHKSSFIVGALCFFYMRWRSREPGLELLAVGDCFLAFASTLAGMGEQGSLPYEIWTFGSFSVGVTGYALMAVGTIRLSGRRRELSDWLLVTAALALSIVVGMTHLYLDNQSRAAIFNANASIFLFISAGAISVDFFGDRLPGRIGLAASLMAAMMFSALVVLGVAFPEYGPIAPRNAFFMLIICHFSVALFVVVLVQERAEAKLSRLANTDALTGIPNRQNFLACLPRQLRQGDGFIMMDIDHFKSVNDRHGHEIGDAVLVGVAQTIAAAAGRELLLARLGGEEFALFLRDQTEETLVATADQIRRKIKTLAFDVGAGTVTPTVSAGVALWSDECDATKLRDRADQALYRAKRAGRDRVETYAAESVAALS
ncbi:GGDEF domain-containing protein (plasmid) [Rhizobium lentis]|uniref:diguanylate cyclase n=2 Tax=Rhizobium lentis TaxID=1138194 RepID=A0A9Q3MEI8_9HYPH|nr:GGDEF domain-containing protein [Rhizobium lentis]MBX5025589.1 GGDEF domain-containing protein [Rhizobium lentis]MBX5068651.1 GGDEF domain-containing protein [Rhizobium lentis]MBX5076850.1 GGDEF domain-containing protein [Rhizobium lentis]QSW96075.1 GGDEF domain-containing protein [Rhizobium lentis]